MYAYFTGNECLVKDGEFAIAKNASGFYGEISGVPFNVDVFPDRIIVSGNGKAFTFLRTDQATIQPLAESPIDVVQFSGSFAPSLNTAYPISGGETLAATNEPMAKYVLATLGVVVRHTLGIPYPDTQASAYAGVGVLHGGVPRPEAGVSPITGHVPRPTAAASDPGTDPTGMNWCKEYRRQMSMWKDAYYSAILWMVMFGCDHWNTSEVCNRQRWYVQYCSDEIDSLYYKIKLACGKSVGGVN